MSEQEPNLYDSPRSQPPIRQVGMLTQFLLFLLVACLTIVAAVVCCVSVCLGGAAVVIDNPRWLGGEASGVVVFVVSGVCGLLAGGVVAWQLGKLLLWRKDMK